MSDNNNDLGGWVPEWTLADRMRKSMADSGLGVTEIATELGVTRGAVGKWINGHITPRHPTLMAWSVCTGVSLAWLETGECDSGGKDGECGANGSRGATEPTPLPLVS